MVTIFYHSLHSPLAASRFYFYLSLISLFSHFHCVRRWKLAVNVDGEQNLVTLKKLLFKQNVATEAYFPAIFSVFDFIFFFARNFFLTLSCTSMLVLCITTCWSHECTQYLYIVYTIATIHSVNRFHLLGLVEYVCTNVIVACRPIQAAIKSTVSTYTLCEIMKRTQNRHQ